MGNIFHALGRTLFVINTKTDTQWYSAQPTYYLRGPCARVKTLNTSFTEFGCYYIPRQGPFSSLSVMVSKGFI